MTVSLGSPRPHAGAARLQVPDEAAVVTFNRDARFRHPLFYPAWRGTERGPVGRPASVHPMIAGDDIALGGERHDGRDNIGGGMGSLEGRDNLVLRAPAVEQRQ